MLLALPVCFGQQEESGFAPGTRPAELCRSRPGEGPQMVLIESGRLAMGSPGGEAGRYSDEGPQHAVAIVQPFALARCETRVGEFRCFVEETEYLTDAERGEGCYTVKADGSSFEQRKDVSWRSPGWRPRDPAARTRVWPQAAIPLFLLGRAGILSFPQPHHARPVDPMEEPLVKKKSRRGIYLLPNLFTTANMFAGFYAVIAAMQGRFEPAAIAIFAAMLLDGIDGRVARLTNTQSDFGAEYDSLADMVAFGVAPALVAYEWALGGLGKIGWLAAFVYTAAAALRLARFNTQVGTADKRYFQGLPSPSAAGIIAAGVWIGADHGIAGADVSWLAVFVTAIVGLLMVSNFRFHSFKDIDARGRVSFIVAVVVMLAFALVFLHPPVILFAGFMVYAVSGPVLTLLRRRQHKATRRRERDAKKPPPDGEGGS